MSSSASSNIIFSFSLLFSLVFFFFFSVCSASPRTIVTLNSSNADLSSKGHWLIIFYAPWCPACRQLLPAFEGNLTRESREWNTTVAKVNVEEDRGMLLRFMIEAYPTVFYIKDGEVYHLRNELFRDIVDYEQFLRTKERTQGVFKVEYYANYSPFSIFGSFLSHIGWTVDLILGIKEVGEHLHKKHQIPELAFYIAVSVFGLAIVAIITIIVFFLIEKIWLSIFGRKKAPQKIKRN